MWTQSRHLPLQVPETPWPRALGAVVIHGLRQLFAGAPGGARRTGTKGEGEAQDKTRRPGLLGLPCLPPWAPLPGHSGRWTHTDRRPARRRRRTVRAPGGGQGLASPIVGSPGDATLWRVRFWSRSCLGAASSADWPGAEPASRGRRSGRRASQLAHLSRPHRPSQTRPNERLAPVRRPAATRQNKTDRRAVGRPLGLF